jgi:high-affinity Fe2+/Pb2+ permease
MKNNRIIIILIIIVILLLAYIVFKPKAVVAPLQQEVSKEVVKDKVVEMKNYENKELGFSFSYPE